MAAPKQEDHWSSEAYQASASFVPKLAGKVLSWLDAQPDDQILDIGCGDGVLNVQLAQTLKRGKGSIHGVDASAAMIAAAVKAAGDASVADLCTFEVIDATQLVDTPQLQLGQYDKVFSNAAMHWILRDPALRVPFFRGVHGALRAGGAFVFEMGGLGNVGEMRAAILSAVGRRAGMARARSADPWFFPDEAWMVDVLENAVGGFKVERVEREYRPTRANEGPGGGVAGWVRLMGKQFFDVLGEGEERAEAEREVEDILETVCRSPARDGGNWIGYVRLRAVVRKV